MFFPVNYSGIKSSTNKNCITYLPITPFVAIEIHMYDIPYHRLECSGRSTHVLPVSSYILVLDSPNSNWANRPFSEYGMTIASAQYHHFNISMSGVTVYGAE